MKVPRAQTYGGGRTLSCCGTSLVLVDGMGFSERIPEKSFFLRVRPDNVSILKELHVCLQRQIFVRRNKLRVSMRLASFSAARTRRSGRFFVSLRVPPPISRRRSLWRRCVRRAYARVFQVDPA